ncbi:MAG TPA: heavy-metal-associated domain-containing protein [Acidimicrobiia bacterium]|nr:heavy-metal-associated domain-containing protein [Acidimicrobiia bacterium]
MADTLSAQTRGWRDIHRYAYVNRPYDQVWPWLAGHLSTMGDPLEDGGRSLELRINPASREVSRPVRLRVSGLVCDDDGARAALAWADAGHPLLFPTLRAVLEVFPVPHDGTPYTQIGVRARYRPPFGPVGQMGDRLFGAGITDAALTNFLDDIAAAVEDHVAPAPDTERSTADISGAPADDLLARRLFIALDGLSVRRGGAVAVAEALRGVPGVSRVSIDPGCSLVAVDHDPTRCGLADMLAAVERRTAG